MKLFPKVLAVATALCAFVAVVCFINQQFKYGSLVLTACWLLLALLMSLYKATAKFSYTVCILMAVTLAMSYPEYFGRVGGFDLKKLIVPLLQVITFGVGCTMSYKDLLGVLKMPKAVLIGTACHYVIMPLVGFTIAKTFGFPPEIAAGIVLVGCCPSGLASNVIAFISGANLALSVTITAVSTLLSPFLTPVLMTWLGGEFVPVSFNEMLFDILQLVIFPIVLGVLCHQFFAHKIKWIEKVMPKISMAGIVLIIVVITAAGSKNLLHVGFLLMLAMFTHMTVGLLVGYWTARALGLSETDCRTVGIEVGMQNGGLASGIAASMGKIATVGLAPAVNGPIMNTTFSIVATWWSGRSVQHTAPLEDKINSEL